ncbi:MAG: hypothetical protein H6712_35635 [Myxococcales bacterium]|nr:hypothetical protein [Myxococcales bacterium]MCB9719224.1 hypothetical protein [Myxococcales bacterium]
MGRLGVNPIRDASRRIVAELDLGTLGAAKASLGRYARDTTGRSSSLSDALDLLGAARVLAMHMSLGPGEHQALMLLLSKYEVPDRVRDHLLGLELGGCTLDHVRELFPAGSRAARHVVSVLAALASFEGLREDTRARVMALGREMGLPADLIRVLIEEAQISVAATLSGDQATLRRLRELRAAIFELSCSS